MARRNLSKDNRLVKNHQNTAKGVLTARSQLNRSGAAVQSSQQLTVNAGRTYNMVTDFIFDNGGRIKSWSVTLDNKKAGASLTYGPMGKIATEAFGNNVRRAYTYDCHGWIEGITTSIPTAVSVLPELQGLQGSVSNDFYRAATTGIWTADTLEPMPVSEDYTERVMYATGSHPRYDGTASAHVATAGGRYDYLFDCHDRLTKAVYTAEDEDGSGVEPHTSVSYRPDFSTEYTYNPVGVPLTVKRYGVQCIDNTSGTATEQFGILDNLSYSYDGMLLSSVLAYGSAYGEDYYGRPGFPTSYEGGPAEYGWNAAGLLNKDSARGITGIRYNWNGQPTKIDFTDKGYMSYTYTAAGTLTGVATYAVLGGKRATKVSERRYCGDFVLEGDSLLYANFGGGYFDGAGQAHYRHADFQGNITMVTDGRGRVEQHTGYYPYGEPWREPTGQPYLYGGKERMRDHALNEYDFGPRRLSSALCLWTAPDPLAADYGPATPYSYCLANPVKYIDPDGLNPVYDPWGNYLGCTKEGFIGAIMIYQGNDIVDFSKLSLQDAKEKYIHDFFSLDYIRENNPSVLSYNAQQKIWTHVASQFEGWCIYDEIFSMKKIKNGMIGFGYSTPEDGWSWESERAPCGFPGFIPEIRGTGEYKYESTVENIASSIIVHEWYSHGRKGCGTKFKSHRLAYKNVVNFKRLWDITTPKYKKFVLKMLLKLTKEETGRTQVDRPYRNLYKKYVN